MGRRGRLPFSDGRFAAEHANAVEAIVTSETLAEAGRRIGLTRERMRQVADRLGIQAGDGLGRCLICGAMLARRNGKWAPAKYCPSHAIVSRRINQIVWYLRHFDKPSKRYLIERLAGVRSDGNALR